MKRLTAIDFMSEDKMEVDGGGVKRHRGNRRGRNANKNSKSSQPAHPNDQESEASNDTDEDPIEIEAFGQQQVTDTSVVCSRLMQRSPIVGNFCPDRQSNPQDRMSLSLTRRTPSNPQQSAGGTPDPVYLSPGHKAGTENPQQRTTERPAVKIIVFVKSVHTNITRQNAYRFQKELDKIV